MDVILGMLCMGFPVVLFAGWAMWWAWSRMRNRPADSLFIDQFPE